MKNFYIRKLLICSLIVLSIVGIGACGNNTATQKEAQTTEKVEQADSNIEHAEKTTLRDATVKVDGTKSSAKGGCCGN